MTVAVQGTTDPRFAAVQEVFRENFATRGEVGAALSVTVDGRTVVDLWGGYSDRRTRTPWTPDTLTMIFSATKGATALCAHVLASRGHLDLDAPVCRYWPEFAAAGKERITVGMLLNHQAGLPAIARNLPPDAIFDWPTLTEALAEQPPYWEPGTAHGYHAMTFGWLVGEVVRRISGKTVGTFFRDEIAAPLGLDFWIGLPAEYEPRVAPVRLPPPQRKASPLLAAMLDRDSLTSRTFLNPRGMMMPGQANSRTVRAAEVPAANGICTARALAGMYAPLVAGGKTGGNRELVGPTILARLGVAESEGPDRILSISTRFTAGFIKTTDNGDEDSIRLGPNPEAFGHSGAGGSLGFADPVARVAFGYVMNQMGPGLLLNPRGQRLVEAVFEGLGA
ncbi:beta-lactamase family protein [Candidatus Binatia bacterium]|nr:beta-lactamase family protein [Candidatus Binatia bacterium]